MHQYDNGYEQHAATAAAAAAAAAAAHLHHALLVRSGGRDGVAKCSVCRLRCRTAQCILVRNANIQSPSARTTSAHPTRTVRQARQNDHPLGIALTDVIMSPVWDVPETESSALIDPALS